MEKCTTLYRNCEFVLATLVNVRLIKTVLSSRFDGSVILHYQRHCDNTGSEQIGQHVIFCVIISLSGQSPSVQPDKQAWMWMNVFMARLVMFPLSESLQGPVMRERDSDVETDHTHCLSAEQNEGGCQPHCRTMENMCPESPWIMENMDTVMWVRDGWEIWEWLCVILACI